MAVAEFVLCCSIPGVVIRAFNIRNCERSFGFVGVSSLVYASDLVIRFLQAISNIITFCVSSISKTRHCFGLPLQQGIRILSKWKHVVCGWDALQHIYRRWIAEHPVGGLHDSPWLLLTIVLNFAVNKLKVSNTHATFIRCYQHDCCNEVSQFLDLQHQRTLEEVNKVEWVECQKELFE
ncbi:hypothetical protein AKJ16_DCAP13008 [Drosera capensis]